jgi:hypothetical protein
MAGDRAPRACSKKTAGSVQGAGVNELALRLIDESTRLGYDLPVLVTALATVVGTVAAGMRLEARTGFYRRFLATAEAAETRGDRNMQQWQIRH